MNKTLDLRRPLHVALLVMLAALVPAFNSCKKETADTGDLLATVPSSAGMVVGINTRSLLEKGGCKVDGDNIEPGEVVSSIIGEKSGNPTIDAVRAFLSGESGVDPSVAILFTDAYNTYITASVSDTKKFVEFVEKNTGETFEDSGDNVRTCGNVALCGAQMWVCASSRNTIDANAIRTYASLGTESSFLSQDFSSRIKTMTTDVVGWLHIKSLGMQNFALGNLSSVGMFTGFLFEDAASIVYDLDFRKGEGVVNVDILNSKGKEAKFLLPMSKIDIETVRSVGDKAALLASMSITKDLTKKIEKLGTSLGGNMFGMFTDALKPVDGTVAVAVGNVDAPEESLSAVVTTDGDPSREFMSLLSRLGDTKKDGKLVRISNGELGGNLDVAAASEQIKGSFLGVVVDMENLPGMDDTNVLKTLAVSVVPQGNGIRTKVILENVNGSENLFLSVLRMVSQSK